MKWGLSVLTLAAIIFGGYVVHLDLTIRKQFEGKRWAIPARVYARSLELYPGLEFSAEKLERELQFAGYRKDARASFPGSYDRGFDGIHLITRSFDFGDSVEPSRDIAIRFAGSRIKDITDISSGGLVDIVRLDPAKIGSFHPLQHEDRILVRREEIPDLLVKALLAVEDRNFFEHHGVDPRGIARALLANIRAGSAVQGGSTLTQQLVKNYFLHNKRTLRRKLNEAIMALLLEVHYSKDEILTAYVNEVFLGQDGDRAIHGFGLASHFYFRLDLEDLNLGQLALLAGMVKGPSYYDPRRYPDRSTNRRQLVLEAMKSQGYITDEQFSAAVKVSLEETRNTLSGINHFPAFLDVVKRHLVRDYQEKDLTSEGLKIFTTLDPQVQWQLETALKSALADLKTRTGHKDLQAAVVVSTRNNGEVQAVVGGSDPRAIGFNRALDAVRPIGSLVKPAVYLTAIEHGYTLATPLEDTPLRVPKYDGSEWAPQNFDKKMHGVVPLHEALAYSYNVATARLGISVGIENVLATLKRLGVEREFPPYPAVLLGATSMTPIEVCQFYQTLAGEGFYSPLRAIHRVLDGENKVLQRYPLSVEQRIDPAPVFLLNTMLQEVVRRGTAAALSSYLPPTYNTAGKTGTSDDLRDSWFAGFTGDRLAVVWVGKDDNAPIGLSGSTGALILWGRLMEALEPQPLQLTEPADIEWAWVKPPLRDAVESSPQQEAQYLPFIEGTVPSFARVDTRRPSASKPENKGGGLQLLKKFIDWLM